MKKTLSPFAAEMSLIATTAIWGSTFLLIKLLVSGDGSFSPFALLTVRFTLATIVSFVIFRPKKLPNKIEIVGGIIIGVAAFAGYAMQTIGLVYTTPAKSGFITSLFVLLIPFLSRLWEKEKVSVPVYLALIPAAFGLWAISGVGKTIGEINPGDKITLLCAFSYAFQIVGIQIYTKRGDWKWLIIFQFGLIAIFSALLLPFEKPIAFVWNTENVLGVIYLAVVASVGALGVQMFAQRFTTSAKASLIYIAEPIFAAGFAWVLAGQGMSNWELVGAGAILVSMIVGRIPGKK
jgi:drug/metabolite transporter (DMT)-like permease